MIGPPASPMWQPWYRHHGGGAPETIVRVSHASAARFAPPNFGSITVPNVAALAGDVIVAITDYEDNSGSGLASCNWGAAMLLDVLEAPFGTVFPHTLDIATIAVAASGTHNVVAAPNIPTTKMVLLVMVWRGLSSALFDQSAFDAAPPQPPNVNADSGPTGVTSQAHELVIGAAGLITNSLAGWFVTSTPPLATGEQNATGSALYPLCATEGWAIVHAAGAMRSIWSLHPLAEWASICVTLKG